MPFADLSELRHIYGENGGIKINRLELADERLYYDLDLDTSSPDSTLAGFNSITWTVELPGRIVGHNADERQGVELVWQLEPRGGIANVWAESSLEPTSLFAHAPPLLLILGLLIVVGAILVARRLRYAERAAL
jgi:hypothetical protein